MQIWYFGITECAKRRTYRNLKRAWIEFRIWLYTNRISRFLYSLFIFCCLYASGKPLLIWCSDDTPHSSVQYLVAYCLLVARYSSIFFANILFQTAQTVRILHEYLCATISLVCLFEKILILWEIMPTIEKDNLLSSQNIENFESAIWQE